MGLESLIVLVLIVFLVLLLAERLGALSLSPAMQQVFVIVVLLVVVVWLGDRVGLW